SRAAQIKAEAEGIANTILAFADLKASEIVTAGQREANKYYEAFKKDESLATFLLEVENLPKVIGERSTFVMDESMPVLRSLFQATSQPAESPKLQVGPTPADEDERAAVEAILPEL